MSTLVDFDSLSTGTVIFDQIPGVRFPGLPRVVVPTAGAASGAHALSNINPGEEFNTGPLVIEFLSPQQFVRLQAGMDRASDVPIQATLRAFDAGGGLVAEQGPISIGPGPIPVTMPMQVEAQDPRIVRVALEYSGAFAEVIDNLEFSDTGPDAPPDTTAPVVAITQPTQDAVVTAEMFIFEAQIIEDGRLRSLTLSITNSRGTNAFDMHFSGVGPDFRVGPLFTGPLAPGSNTVVLTAEDFAGNVATASVSISRAAIEGRLHIAADEPIVLPRIPRSLELNGELVETFPGSLAGRKLLTMKVISPDRVFGRVQLRDPLNDPDTRFTLSIVAALDAPLGATSLVVEAIDEVTHLVLSSAILNASITPAVAIDCGGLTPLYRAIPLEELTEGINESIDLEPSGDGRSVADGDSDIGFPLVAFSRRDKHVDPDGDGRFTAGEPIYTDDSDQSVVSVGAVRLANAPVGGDGSIVAQNDPDLGAVLIRFTEDEKFVDANSNGRLDIGVVEPVYRDVDNSGNVTEGDLRLAKSFVAPDLFTITPMAIQYRDDPFGSGLINVQQRFLARPPGFFDAEIQFIATLRVFLDDASENLDRIRFEYNFILIRAETSGGPILDPLIAGEFEDGFRTAFAQPFRARLGTAIAGGIRRAAEQQGVDPGTLLLLLRDVRITDREFLLGFCIPSESFPS